MTSSESPAPSASIGPATAASAIKHISFMMPVRLRRVFMIPMRNQVGITNKNSPALEDGFSFRRLTDWHWYKFRIVRSGFAENLYLCRTRYNLYLCLTRRIRIQVSPPMRCIQGFCTRIRSVASRRAPCLLSRPASVCSASGRQASRSDRHNSYVSIASYTPAAMQAGGIVAVGRVKPALSS